MTRNEFVDMIAPVAQEICKRNGLWPSVCIAQATIESNFGYPADEVRAQLYAEYNFFGRKADQYDRYLEMWSGEYLKEPPDPDDPNYRHVEDDYYMKRSRFALYDSLQAAIEDYCDHFHKPWYRPAMDVVGDRDAFIDAMSPIYCNNTHYPEMIRSRIDEYDLTQYD